MRSLPSATPANADRLDMRYGSLPLAPKSEIKKIERSQVSFLPRGRICIGMSAITCLRHIWGLPVLTGLSAKRRARARSPRSESPYLQDALRRRLASRAGHQSPSCAGYRYWDWHLGHRLRRVSATARYVCQSQTVLTDQ